MTNRNSIEIEEVRTFAKQAHGAQVRRNTAQDPYIVHLDEAASLVRESGGSDEEIAAAYLHDVVEDTSVTIADIIQYFGEDIATITDGLTDPHEFNDLPMLERKTLQAERIRTKDNKVKRVKLADQISNMRCLAVDHPPGWDKQKYLDWIEGSRHVAEVCRGISSFLDIEFDKAYHKAFAAHTK